MQQNAMPQRPSSASSIRCRYNISPTFKHDVCPSVRPFSSNIVLCSCLYDPDMLAIKWYRDLQLFLGTVYIRKTKNTFVVRRYMFACRNSMKNCFHAQNVTKIEKSVAGLWQKKTIVNINVAYSGRTQFF